MSFDQILAENRRLAMLRLLARDSDYALNDSSMQVLLDHLGHGTSRDVVRADMAWLAEQGLAEVEIVSPTIHVIRLSARGADVAKGHASVPGVARPRPGDAA